MDNITKYLNKIAYKFPKGYPDMNDSKDKTMLFELIEQQLGLFSDEEIDDITVTIKDKVGVDLDKVSSDVRNDILDIVGDDTKLSNDDLDNVKNYISGIKYKKGIIDYISSKGAGEKQVSTKIFNKMLETGEAETYFNYIKNPYKYSFLGDGGNFFSKFKVLSNELVKFIIDLTPSVRRTGTGKGEVLLSIMLDDVKDASTGGDINVGGKPVEVKNRGAIPMGQKAEFGENTIVTVYDEVEEEMNKILNNDISLRIKGTRPFNRFGVVFNQIKDEQPQALKNYIDIIEKSIKRNYIGLNYEDFNVASYVNGGEFNWAGLEQDLSKKIIQLYTELEEFEEILFLNDATGEYAIVPTNELNNQVGDKIIIKFADGMPRWTYKF